MNFKKETSLFSEEQCGSPGLSFLLSKLGGNMRKTTSSGSSSDNSCNTPALSFEKNKLGGSKRRSSSSSSDDSSLRK